MLVKTFLAKFYDVNVVEIDDIETRIEIYEKGEDCEPIGYFIKLIGICECDCFQYWNVYGKVKTGTAYTEQGLKIAVKNKAFI